MRPPIDRFTGDYHWLSNFWPAPVVLDGVVYPTVEHAYVAAKTLDPAIRAEILACPTPSKAKAMGKTIQLRPGWQDMRPVVMEDLLRKKFTLPMLAARLKGTGDTTLSEGNTHGDKYWGVSLLTGEGEDHLGKLLMKIRAELKVRDSYPV